jgi:glyoxylase-like metal-dependent hydrolase (beta-lactamase superfamily II)
MTLQIETLALGPLETNCYVLIHDGMCWLVDIGMWSKPVVELLHERQVSPERLLLTHGHGDHIGGVEFVKNAFTEMRICCPAADAEMLTSPELNLSATFLMGITSPPADELLAPGQSLQMGSLGWDVLNTSGHTSGGVSFYCQSQGVVLTGDALFCGSIGRTDIPNGDSRRLVENIRTNLLSLPDDTRVLPGHGPETTIGNEKKNNPFLT